MFAARLKAVARSRPCGEKARLQLFGKSQRPPVMAAIIPARISLRPPRATNELPRNRRFPQQRPKTASFLRYELSSSSIHRVPRLGGMLEYAAWVSAETEREEGNSNRTPGQKGGKSWSPPPFAEANLFTLPPSLFDYTHCGLAPPPSSPLHRRICQILVVPRPSNFLPRGEPAFACSRRVGVAGNVSDIRGEMITHARFSRGVYERRMR